MSLYRVLVVTNLWPYEGDPSYGSFVQAQMESLRPLGVDYDLLFVNGRLSRWNYVGAIPELKRRLRVGAYDLIHAHMALAAWVGRCQLRLPLVVSFLGNDVPGKVDRRGRTTLYGRLLEMSSFTRGAPGERRDCQERRDAAAPAPQIRSRDPQRR